MPQRIQLSRRKGYRKPPGAVVVARPTKWGNPFAVGQQIDGRISRNVFWNGVPLVRDGVVEGRAHAVQLYQWWLMAKVPFTQADVRRELARKDLACWCPLPEPGQPDICHAAILLDIANGDDQ